GVSLHRLVENAGSGRDESMTEPSHEGVTIIREVGSGGDHDDGDGGLDAGVELHRDLDLAELLHGLVESDPAAVDVDAALRLDRRGDVGRGDGPEQLAALAGARRDLDAHAVELRGPGLRRLDVAGLLCRAVAPHRLGLGDDALRGLHREAARHEVIARVPVGHIDDVALASEVLHIVAEHDLHSSPSVSSMISASSPFSMPSASPSSSASTSTSRSSTPSTPSPPGDSAPSGAPISRSRSPRSPRRPLLRCVTCRTLYGSNAISRATRIARAISRCCWVSLPVTR